MRVETHNDERTVAEMDEMFQWVMKSFPTIEENNPRWRYGKDPDWTGNEMCNGTFDVEWFDFADEQDATMFLLRWS